MTSLVCAMSGETPSEPVVSRKTGHVFEKRLVMSYIEKNGTCPVSNEELGELDLVDLKANVGVKPRAVEAASVPQIMTLFQSEWDAVLKETFELRKQLEQTRQELSHTLYQHDAACRVIARVTKERDEARQALEEASSKGIFTAVSAPAPAAAPAAPAAAQPAAATQDAMETDEGEGITDAVKKKMTDKSTELSKARKKRDISASLVTEEEIGKFAEKSSHPVHLANPILCLDVHPTKPNLTLTGGQEGKVVVFDRTSEKAVFKMDGHSKKVLDVKFHPTQDFVFSSSSDKTVRVWSATTGKSVYNFKDHTGEVAGVSVHATGDFIVSASADKTWALWDLTIGKCRKIVSDPAVNAGYSSASFHPDGLILGTGTSDSMCRVWDVKTQQNVVSFKAHTGSSVSSLSFSENGYYLSTTGNDGFKVWDLRKVAKQGAQAAPVKHLSALGEEANHAVFDYSGTYLACAGAKAVQVFHTKTWSEVLKLPEAHTATVSSVKFGPDAKHLVTCGKDRAVKYFA